MTLRRLQRTFSVARTRTSTLRILSDPFSYSPTIEIDSMVFANTWGGEYAQQN
jgi:hypothetical protein